MRPELLRCLVCFLGDLPLASCSLLLERNSPVLTALEELWVEFLWDAVRRAGGVEGVDSGVAAELEDEAAR